MVVVAVVLDEPAVVVVVEVVDEPLSVELVAGLFKVGHIAELPVHFPGSPPPPPQAVRMQAISNTVDSRFIFISQVKIFLWMSHRAARVY